MSMPSKLIIVLFLIVVVAGVVATWRIVQHGLSTRDEPTAIERVVARSVRNLAIPRELGAAENPVELSDGVLAEAMQHFADHCASCHGNDGRGESTLGQNLYPKAPDMTLEATQSMTDGEIFAIIKNGVRLTGMPAWGDDSAESDRQSWELVHFIRHLTEITDEEIAEMETMNPVFTQAEVNARVEEELFLAGVPLEDRASEQPSEKAEHHH